MVLPLIALLASHSLIQTPSADDQLLDAWKANDMVKAQVALRKGADADVELQPGVPLLDAAVCKSLEWTKLLVSYGAQINGKDATGNTPLHHAVSSDVTVENPLDDIGTTEIVLFLLSKRAEIDAQSDAGQTALMDAAYCGKYRTLKALIDAGADVKVRDALHRTALTMAAGRSYDDACVQELIDLQAPMGATEAILLGDEPTAERILVQDRSMPCPGPLGEPPLFLAAQRGFPGVVNSILSLHPDVNAGDAQGLTPLMAAILGMPAHHPDGSVVYGEPDRKEDRLAIIRALISNSCRTRVTNKDGKTALQLANGNGFADAAALLPTE